MSALVVFQQMIMIFLLVALGFFAHRKGWLDDISTKSISALIVNITNPCILISSALTAEERVSPKNVGLGILSAVIVYAILLLSSLLIPRILRTPKSEHYAYKMMTVYGNTGFIGIPLASAVLGPSSLVYVAMHNLVFNLLIYTHGYHLIRSAAVARMTDEEAAAFRGNAPGKLASLRSLLLNVGTLSAVLTIILYLVEVPLPSVLSDSIIYAGRATTFLSMAVLGASVSKMNFKTLLGKKILYLFTLIRLILIPIGCVLLLRLILTDRMIIGASALMLAVPCANMPLMLSKEYNLDETTIAEAIILTTVFSLITIPLVTLFVP